MTLGLLPGIATLSCAVVSGREVVAAYWYLAGERKRHLAIARRNGDAAEVARLAGGTESDIVHALKLVRDAIDRHKPELIAIRAPGNKAAVTSIEVTTAVRAMAEARGIPVCVVTSAQVRDAAGVDGTSHAEIRRRLTAAGERKLTWQTDRFSVHAVEAAWVAVAAGGVRMAAE